MTQDKKKTIIVAVVATIIVLAFLVFLTGDSDAAFDFCPDGSREGSLSTCCVPFGKPCDNRTEYCCVREPDADNYSIMCFGPRCSIFDATVLNSGITDVGIFEPCMMATSNEDSINLRPGICWSCVNYVIDGMSDDDWYIFAQVNESQLEAAAYQCAASGQEYDWEWPPDPTDQDVCLGPCEPGITNCSATCACINYICTDTTQ